MDEGNASERIEIELTPNDEARIWGRHGSAPEVPSGAPDAPAWRATPHRAAPASAHPATHDASHDVSHGAVPTDVAYSPPLPEHGGPLSTPRRRLLASAAVVAVAALAVGWAVGRTGSGTAGELDVDTSTTALVTTSTSIPEGDTLPRVDRSVVSTRVTTTTQPQRWTLSPVDLDPRVTQLGIRIVALRAREIVEFDTAAGEVATLPLRISFAGMPRLEAGDDWIVGFSPDNGQAYIFRGLEPPDPLSLPGDLWSTYRQADGEHFWTWRGPMGPNEGVTMAEIDHEGNETGVTLELGPQQWASGADPAGGVIVSAPGGTYHVGADGSRRIAIGEVLALSATTALIEQCGDDLTTCGVHVLDRASGAMRPLAIVNADSPLGPQVIEAVDNPTYYGFPDLLSAMSPDGRYAPVIAMGERQQQFGVVDLENGEFTALTMSPESGLWWTPDSRSVMYIAGQRLMMYNLVSHEAFPVLPDDFSSVTAFAVRR